MTTSAAPPYIGVLMAAHNPLPLNCHVVKYLVRFLYLPRRVWVHPFISAILWTSDCQSLTSGLSLYQISKLYYASSIEQSKSFANPCAVFPYAIEKFIIFACFLSLANTSFKIGAGACPLELSHSNSTSPASTFYLM